MKPYLKEDSLSVSDWPEIMYHAKLNSGIFWSVNRRHDSRNRIWNEPVCLVILSAYISIYLKVEDYETQNKMCIDTEYKQEKMEAASVLISSCYQVLW